ncbi:HAD hydrolase-like protein [Gulosibacter bifidus]|uniref:HAD hydrolase-like protein n=1 Tax=Gulosibacter bifidus TaxID=272239 RepID=A0ABW5RJG1_9MICO|nr:HAD hydrolase-like protein [Gulosibacter bifidus]
MTNIDDTPSVDVVITEPPHPTQPPARTATARPMPLGDGLPPFTTVLWDLDGTISDSAAGIVAAMRATFDTFRMPIPDDATLLSYVGPPIIDSFREQGLDDAIEITHALQTYREIYEEHGLLQSPAFEGVGEIIAELHARGVHQSTATSKPETAASKVLEHYGLAQYFDFITGASADESRSAKADVVAEALARLRSAYADLSRTIMIGDRHYDVTGSAANGVPAIYVTWGYGKVGEDEGAVAVATTAAELRELLGLPA